MCRITIINLCLPVISSISYWTSCSCSINKVCISYRVFASRVGLKYSFKITVVADSIKSGEFFSKQRFSKETQLSQSALSKVSTLFDMISFNMNLHNYIYTVPLLAASKRYFS